MGHAIEDKEEVAPRKQLFRPAQVHARFLHAADKKFFHAHFAGNFLEWLLRVADRKWNQDGARPRRNFVDIEPEPIGKEDDLRRNGRDSVVVVLTEEAKIDLGECIDFSDAAHLKNFLAGALQRRMVRRIAGELQPKVAFNRSADVRRSASIDAPATVFVLVAQNPVGALLKAFLVAGAQKGVQQNVIRFEGSIGFEFSAPVAIFVLLREEIFPGRGNGCADATREIFKFAEAELWSGTERRV